MANIPVFWLEPTDQVQVWLRVYDRGRDYSDPTAHTREARIPLHETAPRTAWVEDLPNGRHRTQEELVPSDDPRWRETCVACGQPIPRDRQCRQVWAETLYSGAPSGTLHTLRDAPVGALWDASYLHGQSTWCGPDGLALHCQTPGGTWHIDGETSNCTRPQRETRADGRTYITERTHFCWVRHGDPRDPQGLTAGVKLHVDKNGNTCAAGAGSILCGSYHGFLHHGMLTDCP